MYAFSHSQDPQIRNQRVERRIVPLTINCSDLPGEFLFPIPVTISSAGIEVLVLEQGVFLLGATTNCGAGSSGLAVTGMI